MEKKERKFFSLSRDSFQKHKIRAVVCTTRRDKDRKRGTRGIDIDNGGRDWLVLENFELWKDDVQKCFNDVRNSVRSVDPRPSTFADDIQGQSGADRTPMTLSTL